MDGSFLLYKPRVELLVLYIVLRLMTAFAVEIYGGSCPKGQPVVPLNLIDGEASSIFDDLTAWEITNVIKHMKQIQCFNIKDFDTVTINSTYIALVELLPPEKSKALLYLEGRGPTPGRYAKVILYRGDAADQVIEEYKVGLLPQPTTHIQIVHSKWRKPIPYSLRSPTADGDVVPWKKFICRELAKVESVLIQLTGYSYSSDCEDRCLTHKVVLPGYLTRSDRSMWISVYRRVKDFPLHPIGFLFRINLLTTNSCNWNVDFVWFRNQTFNNMEHLSSSFTETEVRSVLTKYDFAAQNELGKEDSPFRLSTERTPLLPWQHGPRSYMPDGRRFSVNGRKVDWFGWSFNFNIRTTTGIQLHDIRFNNDRIVYEMSLQEILSLYSGASVTSLSSVSMESLHLIGTLSARLNPGLDCPQDASYFDFIHYIHFQPKLYQNAVCLFETNKGVPLKRHHQKYMQRNYSSHHSPTAGLSDDALVLHTVVVTDWHEYGFNFVFHQNGVLEVTTSISGTSQLRFCNAFEFDRFGFQLFPSDDAHINNKHFIHFKVDLDINGRENRFEMLEINVHPELDELDENNPSDDKSYYVQHFSRHVVDNEVKSVYSFDFQKPRYLLFYHVNASNRFGTPRAYRLLLRSSQNLKAENLLMDKSMAWTKNQVAVTQHKDDEATSSTIYNAMDMLNPVLNFEDYLDVGEFLIDEDLTAWVTLESLYVPHTQPGPTVEMLGSHPSFVLQPFNYLETVPTPKSASSNKDLLMKNQISPMPLEFICRPVLVKNSASFCLISIFLAMAANIWISAVMLL